MKTVFAFQPINVRDVTWLTEITEHFSHLTGKKKKDSVHDGASIDASWQLYWQLQLVSRLALCKASKG
jgi:hypothetical protein